jgi:hypothetical protein
MGLQPAQRDKKLLLLVLVNYKQRCHPDRSVAKWRDLQFSGPLLELFFDRSA